MTPTNLAGRPRELAAELRVLVSEPELPLPGAGQTLHRWQRLAEVAALDLALVKLYEGHTDALAIMAELAGPAGLAGLAGPTEPQPAPGSLWATWAAEPPASRLLLTASGTGVQLTGRKSWCSGAGIVTHALVTAWDAQGGQCLAAVELTQPGIEVTQDGWHAVGMGRARSGDVMFHDAVGELVGRAGDYTARPGFFQGGAGIAACWFGGTIPLAQALAHKVSRGDADPHAAAHLGAVDIAMAGMRAQLVAGARWIDEHPAEDAQRLALQLRAAADDLAIEVLRRSGRALGAGPLCRDPDLAQRFADLPVFVRQTHAERDLAELGRLVAGMDPDWQL